MHFRRRILGIVLLVVSICGVFSPAPAFAAPWKLDTTTSGNLRFGYESRGHMFIKEIPTVDFGTTPATYFDWNIRLAGKGMDPITLDAPPTLYIDDSSEQRPITYTVSETKDGQNDTYTIRTDIPGWTGKHMFYIEYSFVPAFHFSETNAEFTFPVWRAENGNIISPDQSPFFAPVVVNKATNVADALYTCSLGTEPMKPCFHVDDKNEFTYLPATDGKDFFVHFTIPADVVTPVSPTPPVKTMQTYAPTTWAPAGLRNIRNVLYSTASNDSPFVPFSSHDELIITLMYLGGFFTEILYVAISRKMPFKKVLGLLGLTLAVAFFCLLPGKNETSYNFFLHIFFGTVLSGVFVASAFKETFAPRINEFSFLVWSMLVPYLLFTTGLPIVAVVIAAAPFILAMINIYTDMDRTKGIRIFLYFLFLGLIIAGSAIHIKANDIRFFTDQSSWYAYLPNQFFLFGILIAYVTPYVGFILQFMPGKHESGAVYKIRLHNLLDLFSNNFDYTDNFPRIYTLIALMIAVLFIANYRYNLIPVSTVVIIVTVASQLIDQILVKDTDIVIAS